MPLTTTDIARIEDCLRFVLESDQIEDWEFQTRLGIDREMFRTVLKNRPPYHDALPGSTGFLVINNGLNEVCNGLSIDEDKWRNTLGFTRDEACESYARWRTTVIGNPRYSSSKNKQKHEYK